MFFVREVVEHDFSMTEGSFSLCDVWQEQKEQRSAEHD